MAFTVFFYYIVMFFSALTVLIFDCLLPLCCFCLAWVSCLYISWIKWCILFLNFINLCGVQTLLITTCNFSGEKKEAKVAPATGNRAATLEGIRVFDWLNPLSVMTPPDGSAAPPSDAQRQRSFHRQWYSRHLRLVCSDRREQEERKREPHLLKQRVREGKKKRDRKAAERERERKRRGCGVKEKTAAAWTSSKECFNCLALYYKVS